MKKSNRIFFTGVPGSRWSGVAQILESLPNFNTTDRTHEREYNHGAYTGHRGAYFGRGMEFPAELDLNVIDSAWMDPAAGLQVVKSHDWAYQLNELYAFTRLTGDKIMLVYRDNDASFKWWKTAGGFDISYPSYAAYLDDDTMQEEIRQQNKRIVDFGSTHSMIFESFNCLWVKKHFGTLVEFDVSKYNDVFVGLI